MTLVQPAALPAVLLAALLALGVAVPVATGLPGVTDQSCVATADAPCIFDCRSGSPFVLLGAGWAGAVFEMTCGGLSIGCATTATEPLCGADGTGLVHADGLGACRATGPAVAVLCSAWP